MKTCLLLIVLTSSGANAFAQEVKEKPFSFSIGAEIATPVNYLKDRNSFGLGASVLAEYTLNKKLSTTLSAGYINYYGQTNGFKYPSISQVPVLVGARYYFIKNFYVSGQIGYSRFSDAGAGFMYSPGLGVKSKNLDVTLKYMNSSFADVKYSNVGLRVAFRF